ncbi:hypothetical protein CNEO3_380045 [Clostridium neonatale]|nr:hypothetical protein CNEO3_380045 [Clostridium neonatale]
MPKSIDRILVLISLTYIFCSIQENRYTINERNIKQTFPVK